MRNTLAWGLVVYYVLIGFYLMVFPLGFYENAPGVSETGPYNMHFIRDVGFAFHRERVGCGLRAAPATKAGDHPRHRMARDARRLSPRAVGRASRQVGRGGTHRYFPRGAPCCPDELPQLVVSNPLGGEPLGRTGASDLVANRRAVASKPIAVHLEHVLGGPL